MHNVLHVTGGYPRRTCGYSCIDPPSGHSGLHHPDRQSLLHLLAGKNVKAADAIEMTRIAHGLTRDEMSRGHLMFSIINTNSPLQLDIPMMQELWTWRDGSACCYHAIHVGGSHGTIRCWRCDVTKCWGWCSSHSDGASWDASNVWRLPPT